MFWCIPLRHTMEPYANNLGVAANTGPRPLVCLKQNQRSLCWRKSSLPPACLQPLYLSQNFWVSWLMCEQEGFEAETILAYCSSLVVSLLSPVHAMKRFIPLRPESYQAWTLLSCDYPSSLSMSGYSGWETKMFLKPDSQQMTKMILVLCLCKNWRIQHSTDYNLRSYPAKPPWKKDQ